MLFYDRQSRRYRYTIRWENQARKARRRAQKLARRIQRSAARK